MDIIPNQPSYTLVGNFSDREVRFPKHTQIAQTAEPLSILHVIDTDGREASRLRTAKTSKNLERNGRDCSIYMQETDVSAIHLMAVESRDFHISRHTALNKSYSRNMETWQEDVKLFDKYSQYCDEFGDTLFKFQTMWGGHFGSINVAKEHSELPNDNVQPVHLAPYCTGLKTKEFEKVEIGDMLEKRAYNQYGLNKWHP